MAADTTPLGLYYYPSAVPDTLLKKMNGWYYDSETQEALFPVSNSQGKSSARARRVLHFGWKYNYSSGATRVKANPFPPIIEELRDMIVEVWTDAPESFDISSLDQCIINRYLPGQGIGSILIPYPTEIQWSVSLLREV